MRFLKRVAIGAVQLIVLFAALWLLAPWVAATLLAAALTPVVAGAAFVANIVVPAEEKSFRIEALVAVEVRADAHEPLRA